MFLVVGCGSSSEAGDITESSGTASSEVTTVSTTAPTSQTDSITESSATASQEIMTDLIATATGRVSPFDGVVDAPKDLEDLVQSALGDSSLDLHRGHDEIKNVLEAYLGISHEEMHVFMEEEKLNLAGVCQRLGLKPENLLKTLEASYAPWVEKAVTSGVISASDADFWSQEIAEALRVRVYWEG